MADTKDIEDKLEELKSVATSLRVSSTALGRGTGETVDAYYARVKGLIDTAAAATGGLTVEQNKYVAEIKQQLALMQAANAQRQIEIADLGRQITLAETLEEQEELKLQQMRLQYEEAVAMFGISSSQAANARANLQAQSEIIEKMKSQKQILDSITGGLFTQVKTYFSMSGQLNNIKEIFSSIMDGNAEYARTTGQIADRTFSFGLGASQFGIGFEKMNKAAGALFTTMSGFSELNTSAQADLSLSAAKLENVGISANTTGKNLDILTKTFKMTSSEAIAANEELARAAMGAGIAPQKMAEGFAAAMPRLAAYGKQALQIYTDLQKQAKSLGLEVDWLTNIVGDNMDTFEGAAKAAGKFNAVMGGNYLNSMELLNATESERVIILKKSFEQSGKNFDSLSKYEKKAVAATLGIQNLDDATKLFSKSSAELAMDQAKNAASQEKLEAVQREAAKVTEQIKEAFNGLMIAIRPLVFFIKKTVDGFTMFMDLGGGIPAVATAIGLAIYYLRSNWAAMEAFASKNKLALIITALAFAFGALHDVLLVPNSPILLFALMLLPPIIFAIGEAADANEKPILALGAAIAMVGAGVFMASEGFASLVTAFKDVGENAPYAIAALTLLSVAFFGFMILLLSLVSGPQAVLTGAAVGVLLAVGGAAAMIGIGMGVAAAGIGYLVSSFGVFVGTGGASIATNISAATSALVVMLSTLTGIGAIGLLAIGGVTGAITSLVEELNKIPNDKVLSLQTIDNTLQTVKNLKDSDLEPTRKFVAVVKDYYEAQGKSKDADKDAFVVALKEVMGEINAKNAASREESNTIPIKLVIADGKEFAASIVDSAGSPRLATAFGGRVPTRR